MTRIGFLGLGAMGSRMAANLIAAGHDLAVWNRDPSKAEGLAARGARPAATPRDAAAGADIVLAMVRDDEASRRVWSEAGALDAMARDAVAVECSTLSLAWVRELGREARRRGIALLDTPVAGSRPQAEAAQLIFLAGGEAATLARVEPVLRAMGSAVHHAGPAGSGAAVKLAVNALFGIQVAATAELIGLLGASGIDIARGLELIGSTPVVSAAAKAAAAAMLAGNFAPSFPVELVAKDFAYIRDAGTAAGARLPLASATGAVLADAVAAGLGGDNLTALVRLYARRAGSDGGPAAS